MESQIFQIKFGVPYFEVFDPRRIDLGVPIAVRGTITFNILDYQSFLNHNQLLQFDLDTFKTQIQSSIKKYVKGVVANVPIDLNISVMHIERKILEINEWVGQKVINKLETDYCINIKSLDISNIEIDKDTPEYRKFRELTADIEEMRVKTQNNIDVETLNAQSDVNIQNLKDTLRINSSHTEEMLRIQREEAQRAQKLQTETQFIDTHKTNLEHNFPKIDDKNSTINSNHINSAQENNNNSDLIENYNSRNLMDGNFNNNIPGYNQSSPPQPPPLPIPIYFIAVNGQQSGPFNMDELHKLALNGQFLQNTMVWKQGMQNWEEAFRLPDFSNIFGLMQQPPPPPPIL